MLTCIYHPIDPMRVVESEEAEAMRATGFWFDCPNKAKQYRQNVVDGIKKESKEVQSKVVLPKTKTKEQKS